MILFSNKLSVSEITRELQKLQMHLSSGCYELVPILNVYRDFHKGIHGFSEAAVWGDFALRGTYRLYQLTDDTSILRKNYLFMSRWVQFIRERAEMPPSSDSDCLPASDPEKEAYLWNADPHFCHNLIPRILSQPDFRKEIPSELAEFLNFHDCEGTLYYAFCVRKLADIAGILDIEEDACFYQMLYKKIFHSLQNVTAEIYPCVLCACRCSGQ